MVKKTVSTYQNPLDWFLDTDPDDYDNLTLLARRFRAEQFNEDSFRTELVAKLESLKYQSARLTGGEKTFHETLSEAGVLNLLLESSTLRDLWKCTLLNKIAERDRELQREKKAVDGQTLRFHIKQAKRIWKDLGDLEEIFERYNARDEAPVRFYEKLNSQFRDHMRVYLTSTKYRGSRAVLLSGRPLKERRHNPRDEGVWTKLAIYRTLKRKLQTKAAKRRGIFDIFLCQLAELIFSPRDVKNLSNGQALYRDSWRSR
jgi:hypothetical protein